MYQYIGTIFGFPIRTYGLITFFSIFLATGVAYFLTKQDGRWHNHVWDIGLYGGCAGIIGGRLWHVFFYDWEYYSEHLNEIPYVWQGGMAIQGGIILGVLAGIIYCLCHKINCLEFGDIVCPSLIFGQGLGRIANFLNGDAFGAPTNLNYGIIYPEGTLANITFGDAPLWPAEIWEAHIDFIIFAILLIYRSTKHKPGQALFLYPILYSIARFFLEFLRGDYSSSIIFGLRTAQISSLAFAFLFFLCFISCRKQKTD